MKSDPRGAKPASADDYESTYDAIRRDAERFKGDLCTRLAPVFNARFVATPHGKYEQKKALCRWANDQLRQIGLAVRCPKTGLPAIFVADTGPYPERGRFRLKVTMPDGRLRHTLSTLEAPTVELIPDPPRREKFAEWSKDDRPARRSRK